MTHDGYKRWTAVGAGALLGGLAGYLAMAWNFFGGETSLSMRLEWALLGAWLGGCLSFGWFNQETGRAVNDDWDEGQPDASSTFAEKNELCNDQIQETD